MFSESSFDPELVNYSKNAENISNKYKNDVSVKSI